MLVPLVLVPQDENSEKQRHYKQDLPEDKKNLEVNWKDYEEALKKAGVTHEESQKYWAPRKDSYSKESVEDLVAKNAPKVKINLDKNTVSISAPQEILDSPYVKQLQENLKDLKGANLSNPEVIHAIDKMNEEIQTNFNDSVMESIGWSDEAWNNYQNTIQAVSGTNPMGSRTAIAWGPNGEPLKDEKGKLIKKTPQEWVDYWREIYNTEERTDAFKKSYLSKDPYERVMALVMAGTGNSIPVYGFDTGEKLGEGWKAFVNEMGKFPEGTLRFLASSNETKQIEAYSRDLNIPIKSFTNMSITNDAQFEEKKKSLEGKAFSELSDDDKAFILTLGTSMQKNLERNLDDKFVEKELMKDYRGSKTNTQAWETNEQDYKRAKEKAIREYVSNFLNDVKSDNDNTSREAISRVLNGNNSYSAYKAVRNDVDSWQGYEDWTNEGEKELENTALWSNSFQNVGRFAGTIGRYLWEDAVIRALTGGISLKSITNPRLVTGPAAKAIASRGLSMNRISDKIAGSLETGKGLLGWMSRHSINPSSTVGRSILDFGARLIGTIPEDIVQTAVDNVITGNGEENANLLNPEQMSDNLKSNLTFMAIFNGIRAGWNTVKTAKIAKELKKLQDLSQPINIDGIASDADDIARAVNNGNTPQVEGDKVTIIDENGNKKTLNNTTPEQAKIIQQNLNNTRVTDQQRLKELELRRQNWVDNDYKDESGNDVRSRAQTDYSNEEISGSSELEKLDAEIESIKNRLDQQGDVEIETTKGADGETPKAVVEVDTPNGTVRVEVEDYRPKNLVDALKMKIKSTKAATKLWHIRSLNTVMKSIDSHIAEMQRRFGDVQASDFDWVWYNTRFKNMTPEQIIGTTDPTTGRVVTRDMIDAMQWWSNQPFVKDLRMASRNALGFEGDFDTLGYLPHTIYDPGDASFDEALNGTLWQRSTGASVLDDNNNYKGFGGDFRNRYRIFASNMLWDARAKEVAAAKLVEEAQMDGVELSPEEAEKVVDSHKKNIKEKVDDAPSTKDFEKLGPDEIPETDDPAKAEAEISEKYKKFNEEQLKNAENSGVGQGIHDAWKPVYKNANKLSVKHQRGGLINSFDTLGNFLRRTTIGNNLSLYDWGGADLVYSPQNAIAIVNRYLDEGGDLRDMFIDYLQQHSHRSPESAEYIADKWMSKLGKIDGITKGEAINSIATSMKYEAWGRIRKWLVMAKYDEFNASTKKNIDRFLFNHMQMDSIKNSSKIRKLAGDALDVMTTLRYDALFYGNIRNALLQTSELNRYFSAFKWGDVATMAKKMATDPTFRARVEGYYEVVAPMNSGLENAFRGSGVNLSTKIYQGYADVADSMKVKKSAVVFDKLKNAKEAADAVGLAPINTAEAFKNRMMVAGLVQEADRLGLQGDEALRYIRKRFERVALAADEMGRIGMASNPLARNMLFLQNFQIREIGMHLYNIFDGTGMLDEKIPKSRLGRIAKGGAYLTKVFGSKLATALILARLGYSGNQIIGLDPFGLLDQYNGLSEDDMEWQDYLVKYNPLFSGGMTSMLADMYFMARKAYEESEGEDTDTKKDSGFSLDPGLNWSPVFSLDNALNLGQKFIPGNTFANRIGQMNELMDTGWATSASGNKMYTAPDDPMNIALGYLFGRSATQNSLQYNQNYGDNLPQTIGRLMPWHQWGDFDPIDKKNYSDWFKGNANDAQQFNKGYYYFVRERDRIIEDYKQRWDRAKDEGNYDDEPQLKNEMNKEIDDLFDKLDRFVDAYESKNGTISADMANKVLRALKVDTTSIFDSDSKSNKKGLEDYSDAYAKYAELGISPVGLYAGEKSEEPGKYKGSAQWNAARNGYYNAHLELADALKLADEQLKPLRNKIKDSVDYARSTENWDALELIQRQYLEKFDEVVAPIIASYGIDAVKRSSDEEKKDLENTLEAMLNNGYLIPNSLYAKNKWGKIQSMPTETVDVIKWIKQRYGSDTYKHPTIKSWSTAEEDIDAIKKLANAGYKDLAMARAYSLKARVEKQTRSLSSEDFKWLNDFLKNGGK